MPSGDKKVQPGEPLDLFPASLYNSMLDVVAWFKATQGASDAPNGQAIPDPSRQIVLIRNDSGATRKAGEILGIKSASVYTLTSALDAYKAIDEPFLVGEMPEFPKHIGRFAILLDSPASGQMSRAIISGFAVVNLEVAELTHRYADVKDSVYTKLITRSFGGAEIIKKGLTETGDQWALIRIGQLHMPDIHGVLTGSLAAGSSASFTVHEESSGGSFSSVSRTETIWGNMIDSGKTIASGSFVWGRPIRESGLIELLQSRTCAS